MVADECFYALVNCRERGELGIITKGYNADGLGYTVVNGKEGCSEIASCFLRYKESLSDDGEQNDHHADQGQGACFCQLFLSVASSLSCFMILTLAISLYKLKG